MQSPGTKREIARTGALIACLLLTAACAPSPARQADSGVSGEGGSSGAVSPMPQRTLVVIVRGEPPSVAARPLVPVAGLSVPVRIFNGTLDHMDEKEVTHPYLAEALPELNTDTWRVFPDGGMQTTYRLRPNLTWQDGTPLTADDFVFGWQVYATPEFGLSRSNPFRRMADVAAPDARTVVIRWREAYPLAAEMDETFQALPRHILEQPWKQLDPQAFTSLPFWSFEYVGLGPYRVDRWEAGAFIEASAFDNHALGRPKIDRLRLAFIGDPNTALANMLTGDAHFVAEPLLGYEEGATLEREWAARNGGTVFYGPVLFRMSEIQFRPDLVSPKALLDVRVRRALAHGFDMPGALEVFTGGRGLITFTVTSPRAAYYPVVERVITKREYDPRASQRILEEAGLVRGADGVYVSAAGESLKFELWSSGGATFERENRIFADSLRRAGFDAVSQTLIPVRMADTEFRAHRPGLFTTGAGSLDTRLRLHSMSDIPGPHNRWQGSNRGGWENAEYDRLWQAYNTTLDHSERVQQIAQMERLINEDVASIPHYFTVGVNAHSRHLEGPAIRMTPDAPRSIFHIHTWAWRE